MKKKNEKKNEKTNTKKNVSKIKTKKNNIWKTNQDIKKNKQRTLRKKSSKYYNNIELVNQ